MSAAAESGPRDQRRVAELRVREALAAHDRGWKVFPTKGKKPLRGSHGCNDSMRTREEVAKLARSHSEIAVSTGEIIVLDEDPRHGGNLDALNLPRTPMVLTGGTQRGRHAYFRGPPGKRVGNSAGKLAPGIDVRGHGGYALMAGSIHPETGVQYEWLPGLSPDDLPIAELPDWIVEKLTTGRSTPESQEALRQSARPEIVNRHCANAYGEKALANLCDGVRQATSGVRNDTLNRAAFSAGRLIASGALEREAVEQALGEAASSHIGVDGFTRPEVTQTIRSGIAAGERNPRDLSNVGARPFPTRAPAVGDQRANIRVPSLHQDEHTNWIDVREFDFANAVLEAIPPGVIYRRGNTAGEIFGKPGRRTYREFTPPGARNMVTAHCRFWRTKVDDEGEYVEIWEPMSGDRASLVLDAALRHPIVRELVRLVNFPVFCGEAFDLAIPGWNESSGTFVDFEGGV